MVNYSPSTFIKHDVVHDISNTEDIFIRTHSVDATVSVTFCVGSVVISHSIFKI